MRVTNEIGCEDGEEVRIVGMPSVPYDRGYVVMTVNGLAFISTHRSPSFGVIFDVPVSCLVRLQAAA